MGRRFEVSWSSREPNRSRQLQYREPAPVWQFLLKVLFPLSIPEGESCEECDAPFFYMQPAHCQCHPVRVFTLKLSLTFEGGIVFRNMVNVEDTNYGNSGKLIRDERHRSGFQAEREYRIREVRVFDPVVSGLSAGEDRDFQGIPRKETAKTADDGNFPTAIAILPDAESRSRRHNA